MGLKDNSAKKNRRGFIARISRFHLVLLALIALLYGCGDNAVITRYDANLSEPPPRCLALRVFPPDPEAQKTLQGLYDFRQDCPDTLEVSTKAGIHCNSNANAPLKATSNFPSAYLRMDLRRGMHPIYSYYIDLTHPPEASDIKRGFARLCRDLKLSCAGF